MVRINRKLRQATYKPTTAEIQQLESRQLPTGIVSVAVTTEGDVIVTGDNASNQVDLNVDANGFHVRGLSGTSVRYRGTTVAAGTTVRLQTPLPVRDIRINMQAGNDTVNLNTRSSLNVGRNATINLGSGNDTLDVNAYAGLAVTGIASVSGEAGNDRIAIHSRGGLLNFKSSLTINGGSEDDAIRVADELQFGSLTEASAFLGIANNSTTAGSQRVRVAGDLNVLTNTGNDSIAVLGVEARGNSNINAGDQVDRVGINNLRVGGSLAVNASENTALANTTVVGAIAVRGTAVNDRVALRNLAAGSVDLNLLEGDDQLTVSGAFNVRGSARLNGGTGLNRINATARVAAGAIVNFRSASISELTIVDSVMASLAFSGL
jgi:hypothetical protein